MYEAFKLGSKYKVYDNQRQNKRHCHGTAGTLVFHGFTLVINGGFIGQFIDDQLLNIGQGFTQRIITHQIGRQGNTLAAVVVVQLSGLPLNSDIDQRIQTYQFAAARAEVDKSQVGDGVEIIFWCSDVYIVLFTVLDKCSDVSASQNRFQRTGDFRYRNPQLMGVRLVDGDIHPGSGFVVIRIQLTQPRVF